VARLIQVLTAMKLLIVADAVFSWFMPPDQPPRSWTLPLLDPIYTPLRRLLAPMLEPIDLSPLILLAVLQLTQLALARGSRRVKSRTD
jgi:uncharacterized protein YggT (Ycf19 family)